MKMNFAELKDYATKQVKNGATKAIRNGAYDFLETWDERTYNTYVDLFGDINKTKALKLFRYYGQCE